MILPAQNLTPISCPFVPCPSFSMFWLGVFVGATTAISMAAAVYTYWNIEKRKLEEDTEEDE